MTVDFAGAAKRLDDIDLPLAGQMIGVGEDEIHAVLDTETLGSGFDASGRPKMLFEPHIFHRLLRAFRPDALAKAVEQNVAYPSWGMARYPKDSYPRLAIACRIDHDLALQSASWGLGQVMGFNHQLAGYASADSMVMDFMADEENHLKAMIRFIVAAGLDDDMRRHDWAGFARGYNGAGFARNGYDAKLSASFARWRKIKDTPIPGEVP
jgi:hypothetical protein